jgi:hypothetical protein
MRAEILPFAEEHLSAAGRLLAERHRRHRDASPLLSPRFEDVATAEAEVTAAWPSQIVWLAQPVTSGVAFKALRNSVHCTPNSRPCSSLRLAVTYHHSIRKPS